MHWPVSPWERSRVGELFSNRWHFGAGRFFCDGLKSLYEEDYTNITSGIHCFGG